MTEIVSLYLLAINILTFLIYGFDKWKAQNNKWRISEDMLLLFAFIGGSPGAWIGMQIWRHKTKKRKFYIGVPMIFVVEILVLCVYMLKRY